MKKNLLPALALTLVLSLTACGAAGSGSSAAAGSAAASGASSQAQALQAENKTLKAQNAALQAQLDAAQAAGSAASSAGAADAGETRESNPIDTFFDKSPYASDDTTAVMAYVAEERQTAWKAELDHLADAIKAGLTFDADKQLVDSYVAAAEEQAKKMQDLTLFVCGDTAAAPQERINTAGTIRSVLWGQSGAQIYRDTFFQLMNASPYSQEGGYEYSFNASAVQAEMDAKLSQTS